jgi:putative ABC transport system permease protein
MTPSALARVLREWTRRLWGAISGRRTDDDLQRELAAHLAFAEDELRQQGQSREDAMRLARAAAGGRVQALEALRDQRGLPWLGSTWLDIKLAVRLLLRNWGLTLAGGLAMTVAIAIAALVFTAFDVVMWGRLPIDEGDRVVAIQMWDREAGRRIDTAWQDVERWRTTLQSVDDVGAFQTMRRNVITADGSIELASIAGISAAGFRVARVSALAGRAIIEADELPGAAPVIVIGHDVWQRRFAGAADVIGRQLRLGDTVHTVIGVMPGGFQFPFNFQYWVPLRPGLADTLRSTGPEGVVFGRLAAGATLERAHAEVTAIGALPSVEAGRDAGTIGPRAVPYTFAFTGDFEPGEMGLIWSLSSLLLVLLLLPPCANIAILNYARTVSRQQEFAARHALGGSRARIVSQLFIEVLVLAVAAAAAALLIVHAVSIVIDGRLQQIPGGLPFWMAFKVSSSTILFVSALAVIGAAVAGLIPAMQATGRLARLGTGMLAGRVGLRLGATWTTLVIAQVGFSIAVLPLASELAWGTIRTGLVGPGFAAENYATARITFAEDGDAVARGATRRRELTQQLAADPGILAVAVALQPPGEEPWVFVGLNGHASGFQARFNHIDAAFFDVYAVPRIAGRGFMGEDATAEANAVIVNRNFATAIAPGGNALGHRFRYIDSSDNNGLAADRWYEVIGVVGNLPPTTDAPVAYHPAITGQIQPAHLQLRLRGDRAGLAERLRDAAAKIDPALQVDQVRTLDEIYREHRFGDTLGAVTIGAVSGSVLLLSAGGLYALMAFTVTQRRREIGIRSALGAPPAQLIGAVFRRAFLQIGAGAAAGMTAAYLVGRYVPIERIGGLPIPFIIPGAAALMLLVGACASLGPVRRGLRVDPTEALRSE